MAAKIFKTIRILYSHYDKKKQKAQNFVIPAYEGRYLIYVPLKGICSLVNKEFVDKINTNDKTVRKLFRYIDSQRAVPKFERSFRRNKITFCMTSACNMRCIYCFALGGETKHYTMKFDLAKAAIDTAIKDLKKGESLGLDFQGGGEPTLVFEEIKKIYAYAAKVAKERNIVLNTSITTNGMLTEAQIKWMADAGMSVAITLDGPAFIQNKQRPLVGGLPSYQFVARTIKLFNDMGVDYNVRCNVTGYSTPHTKEIIRHFNSLGIKKINMESVRERGRSKLTSTKPSSPYKYVEKFIEGFELAEKLGMEIEHFDISLDLKDSYCGADGRNFIITPDGYISSCFEITSHEHPDAKIFLYGKFENSKLTIDRRRFNYLKKRTVNNMVGCKNCFAKWTCAGKCFVRSLKDSNSIFKADKSTCLVQQELLKYLLNRLINGKVGMKPYDIVKQEVAL